MIYKIKKKLVSEGTEDEYLLIGTDGVVVKFVTAYRYKFFKRGKLYNR